MVFESRKQSMAWMETNYSKTHFRWKIKWRLEHSAALGIMGDTAPLRFNVGESLGLVLRYVSEKRGATSNAIIGSVGSRLV